MVYSSKPDDYVHLGFWLFEFFFFQFFTEKDENQTIITFIIHFFCAGQDSSNIMSRRE